MFGSSAGHTTVIGLTATGLYRSAMTVESWADQPIGEVVVRDVSLQFAGSDAPMPQTARAPGGDVRLLPARGFYARNDTNLTLEDVRLSVIPDDLRTAILAEDIGKPMLDYVRFTQVDGCADPVVLRDVGTVKRVPPVTGYSG